ncbi:hypothetical protein BDZ97DRAFT_1922428 [Flammula alnicola]|nr:hypothetical protein BDZ97DRAFT_1922428 [Flammula alnicola]
MPPSAAPDIGQAVKPSGTPTPTTNKPRLLTLVLLTSGEGANAKDKERYAIVRHPASYQETVASALKALGRYVSDPRAENIELLYPIYDKDGGRLWAETDPEDWDLIMEAVSGKEVGVREKDHLAAKSKAPFANGSVMLTCGHTENSNTTWSGVYAKDLTPKIDRPKSYREAIESVKNILNTQGFSVAGEMNLRSKFRSTSKNLNDSKVKFHSFVSSKGGVPTTDFWTDFPDEAYTDDEIWRIVVPKAHEILGFTLH